MKADENSFIINSQTHEILTKIMSAWKLERKIFAQIFSGNINSSFDRTEDRYFFSKFFQKNSLKVFHWTRALPFWQHLPFLVRSPKEVVNFRNALKKFLFSVCFKANVEQIHYWEDQPWYYLSVQKRVKEWNFSKKKISIQNITRYT